MIAIVDRQLPKQVERIQIQCENGVVCLDLTAVEEMADTAVVDLVKLARKAQSVQLVIYPHTPVFKWLERHLHGMLRPVGMKADAPLYELEIPRAA